MDQFMPIPFPRELEDLIPYPGDQAIQARRRHAQYKADDWAKRHRLPDNDPKEVVVQAHTRRKADK